MDKSISELQRNYKQICSYQDISDTNTFRYCRNMAEKIVNKLCSSDLIDVSNNSLRNLILYCNIAKMLKTEIKEDPCCFVLHQQECEIPLAYFDIMTSIRKILSNIDADSSSMCLDSVMNMSPSNAFIYLLHDAIQWKDTIKYNFPHIKTLVSGGLIIRSRSESDTNNSPDLDSLVLQIDFKISNQSPYPIIIQMLSYKIIIINNSFNPHSETKSMQPSNDIINSPGISTNDCKSSTISHLQRDLGNFSLEPGFTAVVRQQHHYSHINAEDLKGIDNLIQLPIEGYLQYLCPSNAYDNAFTTRKSAPPVSIHCLRRNVHFKYNLKLEIPSIV